MKFVKKLFKKENFLPLLIVIVAGILAARTLIFESGYFNMHDDLQMMRQLEMEKCLLDGQIPCRWVPDMGYGYGFPLFNFYPPLPYITGQVFRIMQFSFVDAVKLTFALAFILSGITMYFLAKEFFGKWGGVVSSVFYIWAPYHSVDIYVRGAMNEAWALIWFPLILFTSYKLITEEFSKNLKLNKSKLIENWKLIIGNSKWIIPLGLSWVGLLLSHNLMVMIFTPVFAVWCLVFWLKDKNWIKFFRLVLAGIMAFALSAFFTLPSILEQKFVHVDTLTQGYYEYIAHFATIGQLLITREWGYGPSIWGPNDGMPFSVGHIHWILSIIIFGIWLYSLIFKKNKNLIHNSLFVIPFSMAVGWFAAFMTHQNSTLIWQKINFLSFVQFPWRFLTLSIFGLSFLSGAIVLLLKSFKKTSLIVAGFLTILVVVFNWNYFLPLGGKMGYLTDAQKFTGAAWDLQRTAGIFDYLPNTAVENPKAPSVILAEVTKGKGEIANTTAGTNWAKFEINLSEESEVRINLFEFPSWKIEIDGQVVKQFIPETEKWGRMYVNIPAGMHSVSLRLSNTPLRTVCNYISLVSWIALLSYPLWKKKLFK